ncbi:MAG TPA: DEAD/DEAH box helicase family protein [bacterium]|nr:DEAD/DEAH box helicase family protein [bacterium]HMZ03536.1 DEAD/DEAH box helicase family protein [bacterium]HNB08087.1 DEAD/DEAH box helicase family protein [bacterium]HND76504.1 DEAD/DEAH box helicase family protein [bacterium]HNH31704.1 DEAD/DEAH box helicase family protein [bacterium]
MINTEKIFESAIEDHLLESGWLKGRAEDFSRDHALDAGQVIGFLKDSQPKDWEKIAKIHQSDVDTKVVNRLSKELELRGTLDVLRYGFTDSGVRFRMAYFRPETGLNPDTLALYAKNRLIVTRQVKYSPKNENSIDLLLSINGLPVATAELKNPFTGQTFKNAIRQYQHDRDPRELIFQFKKRALVHFAVDPDEVHLTTKLDGSHSRFLPFNKGHNNGAGNPPNPAGYKTAYLWEEVWQKDSWMDIIYRFMHLQVEEVKVGRKREKKESLIFPRFHQLESVRDLTNDARKNGPGKNYLIQHSAGSGKSNSIAWLAYHLSSLHDATDKRIFDSVIVVSDRTVLDQQLQDTIYQFDHKSGVVQKIDENSNQLAESIKAGTPIVITTLQKFPFILDKAKALPGRNYAVIVDEAHSSQGGESSKKMKEVLSAQSLEDAEKEEGAETDDGEDEIRKSMAARGRQSNLSFFAFTATPKAKTLEVFGTKGADGKPRPFHLYSMRQAIEEEFILDVLKNYVTYKTFFKLSKAIEDDPELNKKKAAIAIGRFVSLHPYNLAQKTEIMVEHFRQVTSKKIGGKAKAMVVTGSRLHAIRYYFEFQRYIKEKSYSEIKALVAFSGKVIDTGYPEGVSESELNGFGEKELPDKFETDEYQVLLVADKYQTGFDQPLLHTMYVDKKLSGVKAVQTLSRLNRTCAGKEDTFILDFANDVETILESFQPYYELTTMEQTTDPNLLYDLRHRLDEAQVYLQSEIDALAKVFYNPNGSTKDQARLNALVDPAVDRYEDIDADEKKDEFKKSLTAFVRLYAFLSQVMPFSDIELEKFYVYARLLVSKIQSPDYGGRLKLDNDVALQYYRLQKTSEHLMVLEKLPEYSLDPTTEAGIMREKEMKAKLSEIIEILNTRFGMDLDEADKLFFDQIEVELLQDETLRQQAVTNSIDNFRYGFQEKLDSTMLDRMESNQEIFQKVMENDEIKTAVLEAMIKQVYAKFNNKNLQ